MKTKRVPVFLFLLFCQALMACTDFRLKDQQGQFVAARSMEFAVYLESELVIQPRGEKKSVQGYSWTSRYAYIGITALTRDIISDGMNEKGLSYGALWFPGAEYPELNGKQKTIPLDVLGDWILGNFATVDEVVQALSQIQVSTRSIPKLGMVPALHLALHDRSGKSLVVEFIEGNMLLIDNPIGVLTNAPRFSWQVTNLANYINLTALNKGPIDLNGTVIGPIGQGSGLLGIPGDWTPPSRFVRISAYQNLVEKAPGPSQNVTLAFHLLNTVDIPYGAIKPLDGKGYNYTQWVVVKDLAGGNFYYRTYENQNIKKFTLADQKIEQGSEVQYLPLK